MILGNSADYCDALIDAKASLDLWLTVFSAACFFGVGWLSRWIISARQMRKWVRENKGIEDDV